MLSNYSYFQEHFSVVALVSECLQLGILESSRKFSKIPAEIKRYKNISAMKHIIRNILTLKIL